MSLQKTVLTLVILFVAGLLGYAYYQQYVEYLDPCPLCITQRFFYFLIIGFAVVALMVRNHCGLQNGLIGLMALSTLGGIGTAGRQVWLQHLPPDQVPECGPGLQYWLDNMPFLKTLELLFKGDGNCAEVDWTFLGLSMGAWSLIMFVLLLVVSLWLLFNRRSQIYS